MVEVKKFSLVKPSTDTPFHIDFDWWKNHDNNWRIYLHSCLCAEHQKLFSNLDDDNWVDWVDPETAEVTEVDGLQNILMNHCARQNDFLTINTTLVDAVFRVFLADGNAPRSPKELALQISRPPETILRTLTGQQVFKGLRPFHG